MILEMNKFQQVFLNNDREKNRLFKPRKKSHHDHKMNENKLIR